LLNAFSKSSLLSNKYNRSGNSNKADAYSSFENLFYVKPVQTGYPTDSDARLVKDCLDKGQEIQYKTLYEYEQPVSPHLAIGNHKVGVRCVGCRVGMGDRLNVKTSLPFPSPPLPSRRHRVIMRF